MQIMGDLDNEKKILKIANAYEEKTGYAERHPPL
jgi:Asp-tRNA(Asn)/Glu-tRNA(Gln) amidotransferase A subunit family amidase